MSSGPKVLILFAHPAYSKSRVNRLLLEASRGVEGVTVHDLYAVYPDFDLDVKREQELLLAHERIVLHHPFYWYSTPAILKEWQDLVLEHGWAYGRGGTALQGKWLMNAITTGGGEKAYRRDGHNRFTMRELLAPLEQTARLCGMEYLAPFVAHGTHKMTREAAEHLAGEYRRLLEALRDGRVDLRIARETPRINFDLDAVIEA